ncbi:MAG TPA: signal peptidase I [Anaeromyxobacter sp.]
MVGSVAAAVRRQNGAPGIVDRAKLLKEVKGWTFTIVAVLAFRTFLYEAVFIPSGSMIPTLEIGDYVIVEKWAYGARLPFTSTAQATWSSPKRGDIVVLLAPPGNPRDDDLIKRVVGVGGDTIEIRDGHLWVNGEGVPRERVPGPCGYKNKPENGEWREEPCVDFVEKLESHHFHTYCTPWLPCGDVEPQKVPPGTVWLAGDHRDHSADSRVFGPVPVGRIKGRAWMALASWGPRGLRWDRLVHLVTH